MQCICMYYELLISNTYKCIMDYSIHNTHKCIIDYSISNYIKVVKHKSTMISLEPREGSWFIVIHVVVCG